MENLIALNDPTVRLLALLVLVFGSVFLISLTLMRTVMVRTDVKRRASQPMRLVSSEQNLLRGKEAKHASDMLARVGKFLAPTDVESYSQSRREMIRAGFFSPSAVPIYHAMRLIFGFAMPAMALLIFSILPLGMSTSGVGTVVCVCAAIGFIGPSFFLRHRQKSMKSQYQSAFPDFMDLLVVCVESGLSLQPAIERISRELATGSPEFAANLHLLCLEMRAGSALGDALDGLNQRLDIDESFSLASLLKQSEELGTSLSSALRVYSDEMRDKRLMRAEAKAHALPVKITLPVGFCIFPVILVILFLPLLIRIKHALV